MNAFCSLRGLRELSLTRIADHFADEHIKLLAKHLPDLEDLSLGAYGASDTVLNAVAKLKKLKAVTFGGMNTTFTSNGIMDFIEHLGPGNHGLVLAIDMADPDSAISQEDQDKLRERIETKLDGRFEYQLLRGSWVVVRMQCLGLLTAARP